MAHRCSDLGIHHNLPSKGFEWNISGREHAAVGNLVRRRPTQRCDSIANDNLLEYPALCRAVGDPYYQVRCIAEYQEMASAQLGTRMQRHAQAKLVGQKPEKIRFQNIP